YFFFFFFSWFFFSLWTLFSTTTTIPRLCATLESRHQLHTRPNTTTTMPAPIEEGSNTPGRQSPGHHIELVDDHPSPRHEGEAGSPALRDSKGWDGKLRVPKSAVLTNPEALSDPEYSDDDNVVPGEEVAADEGKQFECAQTRTLGFLHV
ncbi:hypothetical protein OFL98_24950, partial [Escherichia coli]|nr:hypothetical protein [Escherichia coli]